MTSVRFPSPLGDIPGIRFIVEETIPPFENLLTGAIVSAVESEVGVVDPLAVGVVTGPLMMSVIGFENLGVRKRRRMKRRGGGFFRDGKKEKNGSKDEKSE